jgi:hypothetical protein
LLGEFESRFPSRFAKAHWIFRQASFGVSSSLEEKFGNFFVSVLCCCCEWSPEKDGRIHISTPRQQLAHSFEISSFTSSE